jgi:hypothetical protein
MRFAHLLCIAALLALAACATRSISDSGYPGRYGYGSSNPLYKGELSEFDVLGVDAGKEVSDEEIASAFVENPQRRLLKRGDRVMLIQSGAMIPDPEMTEHLEKTFSVSVFTGVPEREKSDKASYSASLRLAAAKAGISTIFVYWGVLESGVENLGTKTVSWIPIIGAALPDEAQSMRIRLKVAAIDVKSGEWEIFTPKMMGDRSYSARINRGQSDQGQVLALKAAAYENLAGDLVARFVK